MIEFPSSPTNGQVFVPPGLPAFHFNAARGAWRRYASALRKNLIVNPSLQISQQNGSAAVGANGAYPVDQWFIQKGGGNYVSVQQFASTDPLVAPFYIRRTTTTGFPTPAGTDAIRQKIEGSRIADLLWGTAEAKQVVLRCTAWASVAGLFAFALGNGAYDRSYVIPVNLTTTPQVFTFVIPGDTEGVWPTDTSTGMILSIVGATSTSDQTATPLQWIASGEFGVAGMASIVGDPNEGKWIAFAQVGLYADPYKTGVAPEFEVPAYEDDLEDCMRYWYKSFGQRGVVMNTTFINRAGSINPVPMRVTPSATLVGASTLKSFDGATPSTTTVSSIAVEVETDPVNLIIHPTSTATLTAGRLGGILADGQEALYIAVSARM